MSDLSFTECWGGEIEDTLALGASAARRGGASPLPSTLCETIQEIQDYLSLFAE